MNAGGSLRRAVPAGQLRVAEALIAEPEGRTYPEVARVLGIHLGTVHQHLRRLRLRHPDVYASVMPSDHANWPYATHAPSPGRLSIAGVGTASRRIDASTTDLVGGHGTSNATHVMRNRSLQD